MSSFNRQLLHLVEIWTGGNIKGFLPSPSKKILPPLIFFKPTHPTLPSCKISSQSEEFQFWRVSPTPLDYGGQKPHLIPSSQNSKWPPWIVNILTLTNQPFPSISFDNSTPRTRFERTLPSNCPRILLLATTYNIHKKYVIWPIIFTKMMLFGL